MLTFWLWVVLPLLGLLALVAVLRRALDHSRSSNRTAALPYRRETSLLSPAERSFYEALLVALRDRRDLVVFAKVRLIDLLSVPAGAGNRRAHVNRVCSKHVDFVLCDRRELRPLLVIELDDASHEREDRRDRDAFVDAALAEADLPILRVRAQRGYVPTELARLIDEKLAVSE